MKNLLGYVLHILWCTHPTVLVHLPPVSREDATILLADTSSCVSVKKELRMRQINEIFEPGDGIIQVENDIRNKPRRVVMVSETISFYHFDEFLVRMLTIILLHLEMIFAFRGGSLDHMARFDRGMHVVVRGKVTWVFWISGDAFPFILAFVTACPDGRLHSMDKQSIPRYDVKNVFDKPVEHGLILRDRYLRLIKRSVLLLV